MLWELYSYVSVSRAIVVSTIFWRKTSFALYLYDLLSFLIFSSPTILASIQVRAVLPYLNFLN